MNLTFIVCFFLISTVFSEEAQKIVLKDMTIINASLVKEEGDSLYYFLENDLSFSKKSVAKKDVFKWVTSPGKVEPTVSTKNNPTLIESKTAKANANVNSNIPVTEVKRKKSSWISVFQYSDSSESVQFKYVKLGSQSPVFEYLKQDIDSIRFEDGKRIALSSGQIKSNDSPAQTVAPRTAPSESFDPNDSIPENGLKTVRFDAPTGTEGVKIRARSGLTSINFRLGYKYLGIGYRSWSPFGVQANLLGFYGDLYGFSLEGKGMFPIYTNKVRFYGFAAYQYMQLNMEFPKIPKMDTKNPYAMPTMSGETEVVTISTNGFIGGLGWEWRAGINKNHGWNLELGLQSVTGKFESESIGSQDVDLPIIYFGVGYAYYF
jgi:hypothetical protein